MPAIQNNFDRVSKLKTSDDCLYESIKNDSIKY